MSREIILLEKELVLTPKDCKTNMFFEFSVSDELSHMFIDIGYEPKFFYDFDKSMELIIGCVEKYDLDKETDMYGPIENLLPLSNLVTFSLDMNRSYRGAAHRHANCQHLVLAEKFTSAGFMAGRLEQGLWRAAVNVCSVITESCFYRLKITGIKANTEAGAL